MTVTLPARLDELTSTLRVNEVFSGTLQGEGPSSGRAAGFIRLMGCNLSCSWCDTPWTWDSSRHDLAAEGRELPVHEIVHAALATRPGLVVITGGEPLLHQNRRGWLDLIHALRIAGCEIEVETNGTIVPSWETALQVTRFNVSPKLTHAGQGVAGLRQGAIEALRDTGRAAFKFVVTGLADLDEIAGIVEDHRIPAERVWVQPEGTDPDQLLTAARVLAEPVATHGWNLSLRLHALLWPGVERGR